MTLPDDFETAPSGTFTRINLRIEAAKEKLRLIMDTYPSSTMAHQAAQEALEDLENDH